MQNQIRENPFPTHRRRIPFEILTQTHAQRFVRPLCFRIIRSTNDKSNGKHEEKNQRENIYIELNAEEHLKQIYTNKMKSTLNCYVRKKNHILNAFSKKSNNSHFKKNSLVILPPLMKIHKLRS